MGDDQSGPGSYAAGTTQHDADVVILGMGEAGEDLALRLADVGLGSIGSKAELLGGECPYWACIPSKMMIRAVNLLQEARLPRNDRNIEGTLSQTSRGLV